MHATTRSMLQLSLRLRQLVKGLMNIIKKSWAYCYSCLGGERAPLVSGALRVGDGEVIVPVRIEVEACDVAVEAGVARLDCNAFARAHA